MKILMAVHHFPPRYAAGAELQAYRTALALEKRGHKVSVICAESVTERTVNGLTWRDESLDGLSVRRLYFNLDAAPDPVRWEYDNPWIGDLVRQMIEDERPDLFHLYGGYLMTARPLLVAASLGVPTVVSLVEFWFLCRRLTMLRRDGGICELPLSPVSCARCLGEDKRRYRIPGTLAPDLMQVYWHNRPGAVRKTTDRMSFLLDALGQADVVVSQSRFVHEMFERAGIAPDRLQFCRQGQVLPVATQPRAPGQDETLHIGFLGQIVRHKGVHLLISAVRSLRRADIKVTIYGDLLANAEYVEELRRLIDDDPRFTLAGRLAREEVPNALRNLDVVVVPSLWYENSPNVIFEAFACQTPVVATNLGGMAELVQHDKNGMLFELGSVHDLAYQLQRLLDDQSLLATLREGIEPVRTLDQEMDELEEIYASAIRGRRAPAAATSVALASA